MIVYFVITYGRSGLMARFDEDGRLVEWTPRIKRASLFLSAEAGMAAIRAICRPEIDAAVRAGRAVRERDEESGETVVMDYSGGRARPLRIPSIPQDVGMRSLAEHEETGRLSIRHFTREVFAAARRNPARQTEALIRAGSTADEYTTSTSRRGRLAQMARALA